MKTYMLAVALSLASVSAVAQTVIPNPNNPSGPPIVLPPITKVVVVDPATSSALTENDIAYLKTDRAYALSVRDEALATSPTATNRNWSPFVTYTYDAQKNDMVARAGEGQLGILEDQKTGHQYVVFALPGGGIAMSHRDDVEYAPDCWEVYGFSCVPQWSGPFANFTPSTANLVRGRKEAAESATYLASFRAALASFFAPLAK